VGGSVLQEIRVVNFRSARRLQLRPGPICALIGEPGAGKSNALLAVRALLDPGFDVSESDVTFGERDISIEASLADGRTVSLTRRDGAPPIAHFPAALRSGRLVAGKPEGAARAIHRAIRHALEAASVAGARVLAREHVIYPRAVRWLLDGELVVERGVVRHTRGAPQLFG